MTGNRLPPDDPLEWLNRAKSSHSLTRRQSQEIYLEDLCFQAQQAAEKAIKAVYIAQDLVFPYVHDLSQLLAPLCPGKKWDTSPGRNKDSIEMSHLRCTHPLPWAWYISERGSVR